MMINEPAAARFFLRPLFNIFVQPKTRYKLKIEGLEKVRDFQGPGIVFSNHVHTMDPFLISISMPFYIRWVAGSYLFRMRFLSHLLKNWVGAIPKTQGRSDLETIRTISKELKDGHIIGLFAEGTRTWDGDTLDIAGGTAKLIRLFKVPVVIINIENGYAMKPRWCDKARKGSMTIKVTKVLTVDEIKSMSLSDIDKILRDNLMFSHDKWIKNHSDQKINDKNIAVGAERVLYACPKCKRIGEVKSSGNTLSCSCGMRAVIGPDYSISSESVPFTRFADWHKWEITLLDDLLKNNINQQVFPVDNCCLFWRVEGKKMKVYSKDLTVSTYPDRFEFRFAKPIFDNKKELVFYFDKIESFIICTKNTVEFFYDGQQYRYRPSGYVSTLKHQELYERYKALKKEEEQAK